VKGKREKGPEWLLDPRGTRFYDVRQDGKLLLRVGSYHDPVVERPAGMSRFTSFLPAFSQQVGEGQWGGIILDSTSSMNLSGRKWHQYQLNPDTSNQLQWYAGATDLAEEILSCQLPALPCHVIAVFHVAREKIEAEGSMHRQPFVPGRRLAESKSVAACFPELWYLYSTTTVEGKKVRLLQTDTDERYIAGTCVGIPDDMRVWKDTAKVWAGIIPLVKGPLHVALYGDPHTGKSTFARGLALLKPPVYVALFDGVGKDACYRAMGGEVIETEAQEAARKVLRLEHKKNGQQKEA
jgi:hypothetical protein